MLYHHLSRPFLDAGGCVGWLVMTVSANTCDALVRPPSLRWLQQKSNKTSDYYIRLGELFQQIIPQQLWLWGLSQYSPGRCRGGRFRGRFREGSGAGSGTGFREGSGGKFWSGRFRFRRFRARFQGGSGGVQARTYWKQGSGTVPLVNQLQ